MLYGYDENLDLLAKTLQEYEIEGDEKDLETDEVEQEPELGEAAQGPFYLETYNPSTGKNETVEVTREVYLFMRRSTWREEKRTRVFYKNEIQFTSMCNGDSTQVDNFREFKSTEPTPEEAFFLKQRRQLGSLLLNSLPPILRKRYFLYHYEGLSDTEIAEIEGISRQAVWQSIQRAQALIDINKKNKKI